MKLFFLDLDGTLAAIRRKPSQTTVSSQTRKTVQRLANDRTHRVYLVTGRSMVAGRRILKLKKVKYIGNHGFEMPAGLLPVLIQRRINVLKPQIRKICRDLRKIFKDMPKVLIEDKKYSASVHYRQVAPKQRASFSQRLERYRQQNKYREILWHKGNKLWEILPKVSWNKGAAVKQVMKQFPGAYPIAVGDDRTDEDMFKAIGNRGTTIKVGLGRTSANTRIQLRSQVMRRLEKLCRS